MPYVQLDATRVFYRDRGRGQPVLFIHGACENSKFWKHQIGQIGARSIALDLPGHGNSSTGPKINSIRAYSSIVGSFMKILRLEGTVVVGHSMGGAIAIELALNLRNDLAGIVLANSGAKLGVLPEILTGLQTNPERTLREIILPRALFGDSRLRAWILSQSLLHGGKVCGQDYRICSRFDERARLSEISLPVLILAGDHDGLTPVKWSEFLHERLDRSSLLIIDKTAHMSMLEDPETFNYALTQFIHHIKKETS